MIGKFLEQRRILRDQAKAIAAEIAALEHKALEYRISTPLKTEDTPAPHYDPVERPEHYASGAVECIDAIEAALGCEQFIGFLRGQVIKYQWRLGRKAGGDDAGKARWYAARLEKLLK
jgi:hypothetical protein